MITINKLDRAFLELQLPSDDMYTAFVKHVENVNVLVSTYHDEALGDVQVDPTKGTVAFSAGLHGWAFTLTKFARMYAKKFGVDVEKMMGRLWGDNCTRGARIFTQTHTPLIHPPFLFLLSPILFSVL